MDLDDSAKVAYRLLSIGDALVDEFLNLPQSKEFLDSEKRIFCFPYGQKIEIEGVSYSVGGNAANCAVGMSRLGVKTALLSTIGDDWTAKMILDVMAGAGVGTFNIERVRGWPGGRGVIINYLGERTIFSFHPPLPYKVPDKFPNIEWIFLTSMGSGYEATYKAVVDWKKTGRAEKKLAFNPGTIQLNDGVAKWREVMEVADVVLVNREEAARVCNSDSDGEIKVLLRSLLDLGPRKVVVTDGPSGAYISDGKEYLWCPIYEVPVVERTGVGDAFETGFLVALMEGKEIGEAMRWGMVEAASVATKVGAQQGLLNRSEIDEWLQKAAAVQPKVI